MYLNRHPSPTLAQPVLSSVTRIFLRQQWMSNIRKKMLSKSCLTKLSNKEICRFSPPNDLTCKWTFESRIAYKPQQLTLNMNIRWEEINHFRNTKERNLEIQLIFKYACYRLNNGTHSTNSRKRLWCTVWYACLQDSIRFKSGNSWPLEKSWLKNQKLPCQRICKCFYDIQLKL